MLLLYLRRSSIAKQQLRDNIHALQPFDLQINECVNSIKMYISVVFMLQQLNVFIWLLWKIFLTSVYGQYTKARVKSHPNVNMKIYYFSSTYVWISLFKFL